ncbi:alpha-1,4-glucan:maltose-1-phosphate maltosyltransferase 2 [Planomonospora parontospora subsp. parontospora]|uniref:Alpha-1,4-glucan:maltose-1-phosphate maltosyltransferase n=2 Tax=Planomonospora parontospora TaxID=58119 RepID=A0AA37F2K3_9ACTN|nr:alpha-1,4-glucan--maltose-1-phosphate maltosyltransferase [Planomonospora parontospora]GGK50116.1 alpha-1,4-glucan:maltose-1-phosphate maltosyltransferase 2 [Planomonospora parontospora]GII07152.1 alpha-1,4-glucan:maltose-1-phosphate maltosyltransferase 2 [Planomonospora parontospora subsp. parontospora]
MIGRIPIQDIHPVVDCGRYPAKAAAGETFEISAVVFREGHDAVAAGVVLTGPDGTRGPLLRMRELASGTDRWGVDVTLPDEGTWHFRVEAWSDPIATWLHDAGIKIPRGMDADLMCEEGARLFERAARAVRPADCSGRGLPPEDAEGDGAEGGTAGNGAAHGNGNGRNGHAACGHRAALSAIAAALRDESRDPRARFAAVQLPETAAMLRAHPLRDLVTRSARHTVLVHRRRALFGSWYEFFPRSEGAVVEPGSTPKSGTFQTAAERLPAVAQMGFDVVYLPPIHPIGHAFRKGRNNTLTPEEHDPGSPWAIGSEAGGHDAIHPDLGTFDDFDAFVARARRLGMEIALDLALQCSPDHPWVKEHPEWFNVRADGSIAYAENPPKKYQDIYPVNFDKDPEGIYAEVKRVVRLWMDHGVRIFRVDNPHTKPVAFWERLLADIHTTDPDVLFLAEAFTRPPMMRALAKVGYHQSYTYFTWRNSRQEIEDYLNELAYETSHFMRPNLFVNTPDILHEYLQHGGIPAFKIRAVIAALGAPTWGVYSGYELGENVPVRPGSEEYLDSEKYQYRPRDWAKAEQEARSLAPFITRLNLLRRAHPALQELRNLRFHSVDHPDLICLSKRLPGARDTATRRHGAGDVVLAVVNLDPHHTHEATVSLDMPALGLDWQDEFVVDDELSGESYRWRQSNYVRLDPHIQPAHVFTLRTAANPR